MLKNSEPQMFSEEEMKMRLQEHEIMIDVYLHLEKGPDQLGAVT